MSTAQTVLDYVQALKWPAVVVGVAVTYRAAIRQFLRKLAESEEGSVKVAGFADVNWKNLLNKVAAETEQIEEAPESVLDGSFGQGISQADFPPDEIEVVFKYSGLRDEAWEAIDRAVLTDPTGAVIGSWVKVEDAMVTIARVLKLAPDVAAPSVSRLMDTLPLSPGARSAIVDLRRLRNDVAHGLQRIGSDDALTYVQTAKRVVAILAINSWT